MCVADRGLSQLSGRDVAASAEAAVSTRVRMSEWLQQFGSWSLADEVPDRRSIASPAWRHTVPISTEGTCGVVDRYAIGSVVCQHQSGV